MDTRAQERVLTRTCCVLDLTACGDAVRHTFVRRVFVRVCACSHSRDVCARAVLLFCSVLEFGCACCVAIDACTGKLIIDFVSVVPNIKRER